MGGAILLYALPVSSGPSKMVNVGTDEQGLWLTDDADTKGVKLRSPLTRCSESLGRLLRAPI